MPSSRRAYLDWLRGIAVLCMIEWHVLDSWTSQAVRDGWSWTVVRTVGGEAAPLFLFLAGVAVPFAIQARTVRGDDAAGAARRVRNRGWQIFGLAHLFRLQSFLLNPAATWSGLLKPDILNILGLGLAGAAWLTGRARSTRRPALWLLGPALAIIALTPLSRVWWWPTLLYPRFEAYIRPVGNLGVFSLFPWAAYVPAGAFVGLWLVSATKEAEEVRVLRKLALAGAAMWAAGIGLGLAPGDATFWTAPWSRFLSQMGFMSVATMLAWAWMRTPVLADVSGPVVLFGRTSLFVYWVHVELAYGFLSRPLHHALALPAAVAGFFAVCLLMFVAARAWTGRPARPWIPSELRA